MLTPDLYRDARACRGGGRHAPRQRAIVERDPVAALAGGLGGLDGLEHALQVAFQVGLWCFQVDPPGGGLHQREYRGFSAQGGESGCAPA